MSQTPAQKRYNERRAAVRRLGERQQELRRAGWELFDRADELHTVAHNIRAGHLPHDQLPEILQECGIYDIFDTTNNGSN